MANVKALAEFLATEHRKSDANIERIFWLDHPTEVRLIEVTSSVPKDGTVFPFRFAPDPPEVALPTVVVLIHPDDWKRKSELTWPEDLNPTQKSPEELS